MNCIHDEYGRCLHTVRCARIGGLDLTEYRADPGMRLAAHAHHRPTFNFMMSGGQVEDSWDGQRHQLGTGVTVFAPSQVEHSLSIAGDGNRVLHVELESEWLARVGEGLGLPSRPVVDERGVLAPAMARLYRELRRPDPVSPLAAECAAVEALEATVQRAAEGHMRRPAWMARVEALLLERLQDPPGLDELAAVAGVHPVHVSRSFRRVHGETLTTRLRRLRVAHACQAIVRRQAGFAELALELGFADQSHFTRSFRSVTRMTPGQYAAALR